MKMMPLLVLRLAELLLAAQPVVLRRVLLQLVAHVVGVEVRPLVAPVVPLMVLQLDRALLYLEPSGQGVLAQLQPVAVGQVLGLGRGSQVEVHQHILPVVAKSSSHVLEESHLAILVC
jgi:hypothetical protein